MAIGDPHVAFDAGWLTVGPAGKMGVERSGAPAHWAKEVRLFSGAALGSCIPPLAFGSDVISVAVQRVDVICALDGEQIRMPEAANGVLPEGMAEFLAAHRGTATAFREAAPPPLSAEFWAAHGRLPVLVAAAAACYVPADRVEARRAGRVTTADFCRQKSR